MVNINYDRLKCLYCLMVDIIAFSLLIGAVINRGLLLPAAFALAFSYDGIVREALFQAEHYNYYPHRTLVLLHDMYYAGISIISALFLLAGIDYTIAFLLGIAVMILVNGKRYKETLIKGEASMDYDMYLFSALVLGVILFTII